MDENTTNTTTEYRPPAGFDPYSLADAVLGMAQALEWLVNEGPGTSTTWSRETRSAVGGLIWAQRRCYRELHEWLVNIENLTTIDLPMDAEDFERHHVHHASKRSPDEVREPVPLYSVR